ncbi:MAG: leucine-rich repeat protein [Rikenellaceae bacterium]
MKKIILLSMAVAIGFASCQKSDEQITTEVGGSSEVVFTSAISTRASGTLWDDGDEIGVFMYEADNSVFSDANALYTTSDAESGTFTSLDPLLYPDDKSVDFIAYYPYSGDVSGVTVTLNTADQSSEENIKAQDFMVASVQGCSEDNAPSLSFTRKMSKISITVVREESSVDAVLSDILLKKVTVDGSFAVDNSADGREKTSVLAGETISDISLFENESNRIEAIVVPQTLSSAWLSISVDGEVNAIVISRSFEENKQYSYTLTIGAGLVELSGATITDWDANDSVDLVQTSLSYTASEISASNVPDGDVWVVADGGEITSNLMTGVKAALEVAYNEGRKVTIILSNATTIAEQAFYECSTLTSIELPEATSIGNYAFRNCSALTSVDLPKATSIGNYAFYSCSALTSVDLPEATSIGDYAFESCSAITSVDLPKATTIGNNAFYMCSAITSVDLPEATTIGSYAFFYCIKLTNLELPKVVSIGQSGITDCYALLSIDLPEATSIGKTALAYNPKLKSIILPKATSIGEQAFTHCTDLESVNLPKATLIGDEAFKLCESLTTLKLTVEEEITCGTYLFDSANDPSNITLYISEINDDVENLTDGTYKFKEIIYND